jgi:hypothetical protein
MVFPSDIKACMRDCILSVMWAKDDIYSFFKNYCTQSDLKVLDNYKEQLTRVAMVDRVFDHLSSRTDGGLGAFRAMLQSLTEWSHFDPYYFDKLKKLNRDEATRKINHLRQLQEIRDAKIKADRERQEKLRRTQQEAQKNIVELKKTFLDLHGGKMPIQKRGYELEKILLELGRLSQLEVTEPFRVVGEQIDGAVKYDGEHYLIEAKWQDQAASNEPVYQFVGKVEGKMYGRGVFVSIHGFSDHVVRSILIGKAIKTIFIDGEDLVYVLEEKLSFSQLVDIKVKAAQTRGEIYVHPLTGKAKVP